MSNQLTISYIDGTTASCTPTLFDTMKAERFGTANGWGNIQAAPIENTAYAAYAALRRNGQLAAGQSFDDWAQTVASITADAKPAPQPPTAEVTGIAPQSFTADPSTPSADPLEGGRPAVSANTV
jgi:hypothetical protein